ncbi:MAG: DUF3387 domain-containing protein [Deltaproteobacteria bacterium]|nr:DUF3387 domain-containing protein [Deltaproteobacteria bacterium]
MSSGFTESVVEEATLEWFGELGYQVVHGPDIAPDESGAERILRKYGYPPDKQEAATHTVLQQAELLSNYWTTLATA